MPLRLLCQTRHLFTPRIAGCHISLFYYGGFCYIMSRRYLDAARAFNTVLAYIQRYGGLFAPGTSSVSVPILPCICRPRALHVHS